MIDWSSVSRRKTKLLKRLLDGAFSLDFQHSCEEMSVDPRDDGPLSFDSVPESVGDVWRTATARSQHAFPCDTSQRTRTTPRKAHLQGKFRSAARDVGMASGTREKSVPGVFSRSQAQTEVTRQIDRVCHYVDIVDHVCADLAHFLKPGALGGAADCVRMFRGDDFNNERIHQVAEGDKEASAAYRDSLGGLGVQQLTVDELIWQTLAAHVIKYQAWCRKCIGKFLTEPLEVVERPAGIFESQVNGGVQQMLRETEISRHREYRQTLQRIMATAKAVLDTENRKSRAREIEEQLAMPSEVEDLPTDETSKACEVSQKVQSCLEETLVVQHRCMTKIVELQMRAVSLRRPMPRVDNQLRDLLKSTTETANTLWEVSNWICEGSTTRIAFCDQELTDNVRRERMVERSRDTLDLNVRQTARQRDLGRQRAVKKMELCSSGMAQLVSLSTQDSGFARPRFSMTISTPTVVEEVNVQPLKVYTMNDAEELSGLSRDKLLNIFPDHVVAGEEEQHDALHHQSTKPKQNQWQRQWEKQKKRKRKRAIRLYSEEERVLISYSFLLEEMQRRRDKAHRRVARIRGNLEFKISRKVTQEVAHEMHLREVEKKKSHFHLVRELNNLKALNEVHRQEALTALAFIKKKLAEWEAILEVQRSMDRLARLSETLAKETAQAEEMEREVDALRTLCAAAAALLLELKLSPCDVDAGTLELLRDPTSQLSPEEYETHMACTAKAWLREKQDHLDSAISASFMVQATTVSTSLAVSLRQQGLDGSVWQERVWKALGVTDHGRENALIKSVLRRLRWKRANGVIDPAAWETSWLVVFEGLELEQVLLRRPGATHNSLFDVLGRIHLVDQKRIEPLPRHHDGLCEFLPQVAELERAMLRAERYWKSCEPVVVDLGTQQEFFVSDGAPPC